MAKAKSSGSSSSSNDVACAVLSYFLVGIVWYFVDEQMKRSALAKWHAKQSLVLLVVAVVANIAGMILMMIPFIGWLVSFAISICILVLWIMGLIAAASKKTSELPLVGSFAHKLNF